MYRYKFYFKDGTDKLSDCWSKNPESLYNDFDGLMDWEEFDALEEKDMTTKKILEMAMVLYKGFLKDFYRIEIINDETGKVVDYIEEERG